MSEPGTDIVERLREHREKPTADPDIVQISEPSELALEAADTITHLRSQLEAHKQCREALEFYASEYSWLYNSAKRLVDRDAGRRAKSALAQLSETEKG